MDLALCEANGVCEREAPEVFRVEDDDTLTILAPNPEGALLEAATQAVARCPKAALRLEEEL